MKETARQGRNILTIALFILAITATGAWETFAQTCSTAPANLVSWYRGEDNALDFLGRNNGTIQGSVTFTNGYVGRTFTLGGNGDLSGSGDRVIVGNPANLQLQNFTIEAWIKRSSSTIVTNSPVSGFAGGTFFAYGQNGYGFVIEQVTNRIGLTNIGASAVYSTATITDTNFHHVAVTKSGNQVTFYIDGVAGAPVTYNTTFSFTTNAAIGARGDSDARNAFFGSIDELSIYNRALTAAEIQAIVAAGTAGKCTTFTFTVTNANDSGAGSLRQAIIDANASGGDDTIGFGSLFNTPQTITLTTGVLGIVNDAGSLAITGPGANLLTINGNNQSAIFRIFSGGSSPITISGMTVTGGNSVGNPNGYGGAIYTAGNLTLDNVIVTGNTATFGGGILSDVSTNVAINNSTISNNIAANQGGGINENGTSITITNSTFSGNSAPREGGGMFTANGTATITGSTFSNNSVTTNVFGGGGISFFQVTANVTNSTFSGNTSAAIGGGIRTSQTTLTLTNTTVANNSATSSGGGVIENEGSTVNIKNSLIGDNSATSSGPDVGGIITSQGYNLIENTSGATVNGSTTGNITGQDPNLGTLADNGGMTFTHALLVGSPAIDAADPANFPATDQRGVMRPIDGDDNGSALPDIGSFERTAPTAASVMISGRVTNYGRGISGAIVALTNGRGIARTARTNQFGYFRFEDVEAGQTYIIDAHSKRYIFAPQVITLNENLTNLNFSPTARSNWQDSKGLDSY